MTLVEKFEQAYQDVDTLTERPSNEDLLSLYAYYKQATIGDNNTERPGGFDFKAAAKYNAWEKLKGQTKEEAMEQYVQIINRLKG
jgi:acyl-CoA-binding protein